MSADLLLVGAGAMGAAYGQVLQELGMRFDVVGRGDLSAQSFETSLGLPVFRGGVGKWILQRTGVLPGKAIVAIPSVEIGNVVEQLVHAGVRSILVEKPGGINAADVRSVARFVDVTGADVRVAYNRRFYASTQFAREIIQEDGGVSSFHFEFTEWGRVVASSAVSPALLAEWFLNNSTHVADLAFHLGGWPVQLSSFTAGSTAWHPGSAVYAGAGIAETGALFSYQANWSAPGRWGVEVLTNSHRLIFRPMEKLQLQRLNSVAVEPVTIDENLDLRFKPGIYRQTEAFLNDDYRFLASIQEQADRIVWYEQMARPDTHEVNRGSER